MAENKYTNLIEIIFAAKNAGKTNAEIKKMFDTIDDGEKKTKKGASAMGDFEKALRRAAIVAPVWMALRTAMQGVLNLISEQTKFLIEMESAMARIEIVGKGTTEEYTNMKNSLVALSFAYGQSAKDALEAAKIFAQQGKSVRDTLILTQQAMLAAQVLGTDTKTVVENLTSALNAFKIPMQESVSIIDKWIGVEKEFAVTAKDLSDATKVTGATANQLGITISEFLGDVTSVIEVTRKSGAEAARGLGFIYARLLTSGKPVVEQISKIPFYLDEQGNATNRLTGNLRSATDILGDLASKWNTLTNEERLEIATSVASKRQMTVFNALMQNYNRSIDARVRALTSAGQSERAFNIVQETTAFKLNQVKSAWNNLTNAIGGTGAFKAGLDTLNRLIFMLTLMFNQEKAYAGLASKTIVAETNKAEKYFTQAANLREVIKLRDKLLKAPTSDDNIQRIEALNKAIDEVAKKRPELKLAIELGNKDVTEKIIDDMQKEALKKAITVKVQGEFIGKIAPLEEQLRETPFGKNKLMQSLSPDLKKMNEELNKLYIQQSDEIQKQYNLAIGEYEVYKSNLTLQEEDVDNEQELTEAQKEQLSIARQLSNYNILNSDNLEGQIQKEIELVQASKFQYNQQEKSLKLEQLHNQLIDARLKKRQEEVDKVKSLLIQYEQANVLERNKLSKLIELQTMSTREVVTEYETSPFAKNLILENFSNFTQEIQDEIAKMIAYNRNINEYQPVRLTTEERYYKPSEGATQKEPFTYTPVQIGAIPITVNVEELNKKLNAEDAASDIANQVKDSLLTDEEFQSAFSRKISGKI